ncbi:MAG TPA: ABC transporter permease subunit [Nitrososphaerales archaeon]|nr:ABC transporter permease subunit [Nitrososphaerales archaeon]
MATRIPASIAVAVTVLFVLPIFYLATATSPAKIIAAAQEHFTITATLNSITYAALSAGIGVLLGAFYSWLVDRTNVPGRSALRILILLPLGIPQFIKGLAWIFLLSPRIGIINVAFMSEFGTQVPLFNIFSLGGMVLVSSFGTVSLSYLIVSAALKGIDPSLEESSQATGMGTIGTFFRVVLPLLRPALLAAFLLNFLGVLSLFDIAFIIGIPAKILTLIVYVYTSVNSTIPDYSLGASLSFIYLAITVGLALFYMYTTRRSFRFRTVGGREGNMKIIDLGKWRYAGLAVCLAVLTLSFFLLAAIIFLVSLTHSYNGQFTSFLRPTFANYQAIYLDSNFWSALETSFIISFSTALITMFLATMFAYAIIRSRGFRSRVFDFMGFVPTAFPGVVYDLGLLWMFIGLPVVNHLYGTIWPIILALVAIWIARPIRIITSRMIQISEDLESAASVTGDLWINVYRKVVLPLLALSLFNSFVYVFIDSFRELGAVTLLSTGQAYPLTIYIQQLYSNNAASLGQIAAISTVMTAIMVSFLAVALLILKRRGTWVSESI